MTSTFISGSIYFILSKVFPPTSTLLDHTIESIDDEAAVADKIAAAGVDWEYKGTTTEGGGPGQNLALMQPSDRV